MIKQNVARLVAFNIFVIYNAKNGQTKKYKFWALQENSHDTRKQNSKMPKVCNAWS